MRLTGGISKGAGSHKTHLHLHCKECVLNTLSYDAYHLNVGNHATHAIVKEMYAIAAQLKFHERERIAHIEFVRETEKNMLMDFK